MSFPRHTTLLIGGSDASGSFFAGTPTLLTEAPDISESGWDSLTATYALRVADLTAESIAALWPIGRQLGSRNWWVAGSKPACVAPGVWTAEIKYKGWAAMKPCKINHGTAVDSQSGTNIFAPVPHPGSGSVSYPKVATFESTPTISLTYLSANVEAGWPVMPSLPNLLVGRQRTTALTDPVTGATITWPPLAPSVWDFLTESVYHWPNGWILMDLQTDILPGTRAGLVTESYKYIRAISP